MRAVGKSWNREKRMIAEGKKTEKGEFERCNRCDCGRQGEHLQELQCAVGEQTTDFIGQLSSRIDARGKDFGNLPITNKAIVWHTFSDRQHFRR